MRTRQDPFWFYALLALQVVYWSWATAFLASRSLFPPMTLWLVLSALVLMAYRGSSSLLTRLLPLALSLLCYRALGAFSASLAMAEIHTTDVIHWERLLTGGSIPAVWWQNWRLESSLQGLADWLANILYGSHFVSPLLAALAVHRYRSSRYWLFIFHYLLLTYLGFATYALFPTAPPWWATQEGFLTGSERVLLSSSFISLEMMRQTPNPVAAIPSMHCALPLFLSLVVLRFWGRRWWPAMLLPALIGWAVVYLGHHYVIDVLIGYLYGGVGYLWLEFSYGSSR